MVDLLAMDLVLIAANVMVFSFDVRAKVASAKSILARYRELDGAPQ